MATTISKSDMALWARSMVDWSQSPFGFYAGTVYIPAQSRWVPTRKPIRWEPDQERVLRWAFTLDENGKLPIHTLWWVDIGKSGKTLLQAAVAQWMGMFVDPHPPTELALAANALKQADVRCYAQLKTSLLLNPYLDEIADVLESEVRFLITGHVCKPVPMKAASQAGGNEIFVGIDEIWAYATEAARRFMAEKKQAPTRNISFQLITTYPGYVGDEGPLEDTLDFFFDENERPRPGIEKVPGLEDLPLWVHGGEAVWWNHDAGRYPWITDSFLREQREEKLRSMENEYLRIWEARRVQNQDAFIYYRRWDACTDNDWMPASREGARVAMVIGVDIGVKNDSSACVARGYDTVTGRYPLYAHKIWDPGNYTEAEKKYIVSEVEQWILDMHRRHNVLGVYFDPTQALHMAARLEKAKVKVVEVSQGKDREQADTNYRQLIYDGTLRNYPQSHSLRAHVLNAVARYTRGGLRLDKLRTTLPMDAAVADSQACFGVTKLRDKFEMLARPHYPPQPRRNPYKEVYSRYGKAQTRKRRVGLREERLRSQPLP